MRAMLHPRVQIASRNGGQMDPDSREKKAVLVSKKETTELLGDISMRTLDYMIAKGEIRTVRIGKRRLVLRSEIDRIARSAR